MYEAFRKAAKEKPRDPTARDVFKVSDNQRQEKQVERKAKEVEGLKTEFRAIGSNWFLLKGNPVKASWQRVTETSLKQNWQRAIAKLSRFDADQQASALDNFSQGMDLSEEHLHPAYYRVEAELSSIWSKIDLLRRLRGRRQSLSPVSRMYIEVVKDIAGYSDEQKKSLDEFMEANLPQERVQLPQTIKTLTLWLQKPL